MATSVLQEWVMQLGLRHQGVLVTAVRGCDTAPKNDASKLFSRIYRPYIMNAFVGDASRASTFMTVLPFDEEVEAFTKFRKNLDHYPHHYVMHIVHAIEIVGYKHPLESVRLRWTGYYHAMCRGLHVAEETELMLDMRLLADEKTFGEIDKL